MYADHRQLLYTGPAHAINEIKNRTEIDLVNLEQYVVYRMQKSVFLEYALKYKLDIVHMMLIVSHCKIHVCLILS